MVYIVYDSTGPQKTEKRCHIYLILRLQFPLLNKPDNKPRQGCSLAAEPIICSSLWSEADYGPCHLWLVCTTSISGGAFTVRTGSSAAQCDISLHTLCHIHQLGWSMPTSLNSLRYTQDCLGHTWNGCYL